MTKAKTTFINGVIYADPATKRLWKYDASSTRFVSSDGDGVAFLDDEDAACALFIESSDPGDRVLNATAKDKAERKPEPKDFEKLIAYCNSEAFQPGDLPGGADRWCLLALNALGGIVRFEDSGKVKEITATWAMLEQVYDAAAAISRKAAADELAANGGVPGKPEPEQMKLPCEDDAELEPREPLPEMLPCEDATEPEPVLNELVAPDLIDSINAGLGLSDPDALAWWRAQEEDYQEYWITMMTPEMRASELALVASLKASPTPPPASDAMALAAGGASASSSETTDNRTAVEVDGQWIDVETGEILTPESACESSGFVFKHNQIVDTAGVNWFIELDNAITSRIENRLRVAATKTARDLKRRERLHDFFMPQVRQVVEPLLPRFTRGKHVGELKAKNWKGESGGVFFKKSGGLYIQNFGAVYDWAERLEPSKWAQFGISRELKIDRRKLLKAVEAAGVNVPGIELEPVHELATCSLGVERAWSFASAKKILSDTIDCIAVKDGEEAE